MSEQSSGWASGNFDGPNKHLCAIAENLVKLARLGLLDKVAKMQAHVNATAERLPKTPEVMALLDRINNIKVSP